MLPLVPLSKITTQLTNTMISTKILIFISRFSFFQAEINRQISLNTTGLAAD